MLGIILNNSLIIGLVLTVVGGIFTAIGTVHSSKTQADLNKKIEEGISIQTEKDRPIIDITNGSLKDGQTANIQITNSGERPAQKVTLKFKRHPNKFAESIEISLEKVPANGTIANISFDMWQQRFAQYMTGEAKEKWEQFLNEFNEGKKALVMYFYLSYEYNGNKYTTDDYALLYDGKNVFNISSIDIE